MSLSSETLRVTTDFIFLTGPNKVTGRSKRRQLQKAAPRIQRVGIGSPVICTCVPTAGE